MNETYLLYYGGEKHGPYPMGEIRSMWAAGKIAADAIYWREEDDEWRSLLELLAMKPAAARVPEIATASGEPAAVTPDARRMGALAWRRFFARGLDTVWVGMLCWYLIARLEPERKDSASVWGFYGFVVLVMLILEPFSLALGGATPGKAVMGLMVTRRDGSKLAYGTALVRFLRLMAFAYVPVLNLIGCAAGYRALRAKGATPWDKAGGNVVGARGNVSWLFLLGINLFMAALLVDGLERDKADRSMDGRQTPHAVKTQPLIVTSATHQVVATTAPILAGAVTPVPGLSGSASGSARDVVGGVFPPPGNPGGTTAFSLKPAAAATPGAGLSLKSRADSDPSSSDAFPGGNGYAPGRGAGFEAELAEAKAESGRPDTAPPRTLEDSLRDAVEKYPDLKDAGSALSQLVFKMQKEARDSGNPYHSLIDDTDEPMIFAALAAQQLGIAPKILQASSRGEQPPVPTSQPVPTATPTPTSTSTSTSKSADASSPGRSTVYDPTADLALAASSPPVQTPTPQPAAVPVAASSTPGGEFTEPVKVDQIDAGFSYILPKGWELRSDPGADAKVAFIRKRGTDKVDAQIRFTIIDSADTPAMVQVAYLKQLRAGFESQGFRSFRVLQNVEFVTSEPRPGLQVIFEMVFKDQKTTRHSCYFFERADGRKLCVTCYSVERGSTFDSVFDAIVKSLRFTK